MSVNLLYKYTYTFIVQWQSVLTLFYEPPRQRPSKLTVRTYNLDSGFL